jgi:alpha-1,6-mannosyltransferase
MLLGEMMQLERRAVGRAVGRTALLAGISAGTIAVLVRGPRGSYRSSFLLLLGAAAGLVVLFALERRRRRLDRRLLIGTTGALLAVAVIVPPVQASDLWLYASYGRMVSEHGVSPYENSPSRFSDDPLYPRVPDAWRDTHSPYGPAFVAVAAVGTEVAGESPLAVRLFFQVLAAAAVLCAVVLIDRRTKDSRAWLLLGMNPLVVIHVVNGAHNDALAALALLLGVLFAMARRPVLVGVVLALAALVKILLLLPLAVLFLWLWRYQGLRAALVAGYVATGVLVAGYGFAGGTVAFEPLEESRQGVSRASIWNAPRRAITMELIDDGMRGKDAGLVARQRVVRWANLSVAGLALALAASRWRTRSPALLVGGVVVAYLLAGAYVMPWYAVWALPVLALAARSWVTLVALAHSVVLLLAYVPDPSRQAPIDPLATVSPWQSLRFDVMSVWTPLVQGVLIVVVLVLSARSVWRMTALPPSYVAISAMTPKWSLAKVPVSERSQTTRADSTLPAPPSRRHPTKM